MTDGTERRCKKKDAPMAGRKTPNTTCQELHPVGIDGGTSTLHESPTPGPTGNPSDALSFELGACYLPVKASVPMTFAEAQAFAALRAHRKQFEAAEQKFRIDRRALAGAVAWEMIVNPHPQQLPSAVGWGKVHLFNVKKSQPSTLLRAIGAMTGMVDPETLASEVERAGYLPRQNYDSRKTLLAVPESAIVYIAGMMAALADKTVASGFGDIRSDPPMLTHIYQQFTLTTWEEHLAGKTKGTPLVVGNAMGIWVRDHLKFLEDAVGTPNLPESR
jgi:hypothetical protein